MLVVKNKLVKQLIIALLSALLLMFVILKADWSYLGEVNFVFQPVIVFLAAFSVTGLFFFRTVTIFLFSPKFSAIHFQDLLLPSGKYQLLSLVTPMHAADLLLPFMLKTTTNTGIGHHFMMVYILRLTDLLVLFAIFILAFNFITKLSYFKYEFVIYLAFAITVLIYIYPFAAIEAILKALNKVFAYFNRCPAIFDKISMQISAFRSNFSALDIALIIASVILTWLCFASAYYHIFYIYDFRISFAESLFCVAMVNLAALMPMQTFGGIGLRESTLLLGLLMLGYSVELGAAYAVVIRLTALLLQLIVFFVIFLVLSILANNKNT